MPRSLHMPLDPLLDSLDVILAIIKVIPDILRLATGHEIWLRWFTRFVLDAPATVLNAGAEVVGAAVYFGIFEIKVLRCSGRLIGVEPVTYQTTAS